VSPRPGTRRHGETDADLLDAVPDGVVLADRRGAVTHVNDRARELLGLAPEADVRGRPLGEVLALQDLDGRDWFEVTDPYAGLSIRRLQSEQSWHRADGTELLVTARIVRRSPRRPVERVSVSLRSGRARAALDRERSDLVATVAHELRSPLTGVRGFTGTLLARWDRFTDDQKRLILESVHADADRLTRLIAELLEVARIDTGRLSLRARPLGVPDAVARVVGSVRAGTGREVRCALDDPLPDVLADPDRFAQVLTNLVENAVRHGRGRVRVTARTRERDGAAYVAVVVEDEGPGISPEIRGRVFTKFWRHGSTGGTGLGMYIAHGLVTASGGSISIDDAEGGGARVETLWPVYAEG
jgi:PAS domain S-box-containing protein